MTVSFVDRGFRRGAEAGCLQVKVSGVLKIGHNKSDLCRDGKGKGKTRGKIRAVNTLHTAERMFVDGQ